MLIKFDAVVDAYLAIKYVMAYFTVPMERTNATAVSIIYHYRELLIYSYLSCKQINNDNNNNSIAVRKERTSLSGSKTQEVF